MLDSKGFDLWAEGYDISVGLSDEDDSYPFAGYKKVLGEIYSRLMARGARCVLDIGFGTGTLAAKLYEAGCEIYGQDFSAEMIAAAGRKMPGAKLHCGDFTKGLVPELRAHKYDAIVATYSLHHLTDNEKIEFIASLKNLLSENGRIYIGDVAFENRSDLEACRTEAGEEWDDEEIYFVYDELKPCFPDCEFTVLSHCAGLLEFR